MIRRLYDWTMGLADHPRAIWVLALVAFVESSFFPIPPDVLLIPMVLAAPHRAFYIAAVATVASVLGGLAGYGIGRFIVEFFRQPDVDFQSPGNPLGLALHMNGYGLTMGQLLCLPMIFVGFALMWRAMRRDPVAP